MTPSTALGATPALDQFYGGDEIGLHNKIDPNREKTRYVLCMGNHLEPVDQKGFLPMGAYMGGLWVGHSEVEGAPTMRRTNYLCYRGGITPLETRPIPKKADHKAREQQDETFMTGHDVPPGTRGYLVYAGDTLNFLQNDSFRPMGVVEIVALQFLPWEQSNALTIQQHFFPDWTKWLRGVDAAKIPTLLRDWEGLVQSGIERGKGIAVIESVGEAMMESARLFRQYASSHIERNRQQIMAKRSVDSGGFYVAWSGRSKLYASQLGVSLEREDDLRPATVQSTGDPGLIAEFREERKMRERQMDQTQSIIELLVSVVKEKLGDEALGQYAEEVLKARAAEEQGPIGEVEEDLSKYVGTGLTSFESDSDETELSKPIREEDPELAEQISRASRNRLESEIDDNPSFAKAVEEDEGLRGQIKDTPALAGVIEDEE